ncbi:hypothetical protein [Catellatospora tritici]|uniref:hypothetical protein n=1 Tax=Catellatospora tritici TaxID=2851566 RepID=UPI001C2D4BCB|nr:hypothetical protein [Catellatospora tritici]MBV1853512.1 hypothetical protein [Catellatospora tritici]
MTSNLRDAFDDLSADVAPYVVGDDLGRTSWRAGRRRRTRRLVTTYGLAVAAMTVLALAVPWPVASQALTPASGDARATGFPQRIEHQWWIGDLPDQPGPVAGLVEIVDAEASSRGWHVLSQHGHLWRLPSANGGAGDWPALSPDGRHLGYLTAREGPYMLRDLVTGTALAVPSVSAGDTLLSSPYWVSDQSPTFWSPDGTRLLLPGGERAPLTFSGLIVGVDGSVRPASHDDLGFPAGWAGPDRVAWVKVSGDRDTSEYTMIATVTDLTGAPVHAATLRPAAGWRPGGNLNQWSPVVSPGGEELLVSDYLPGGGNQAEVHRFSLRDGTDLGTTTVDDVLTPCGVTWVGDVPAIPLDLPNMGDGNASTVLLEPGGPRRVVTADPGLGTGCLIWASDALAGEAHGWPFGLSTAWWTWWWREILVGAVALTVLAWGYVRLCRRPVPVRSKVASPV